jgi:two-component system, sensor histidine kinase
MTPDLPKSAAAGEEFYRMLLTHLPVGVLHYNTSLVVTYCNEFMANMLNSSVERVVGIDMNLIQDRSFLPELRSALSGKTGRYEGYYQATYSTAAIWGTMVCVPLRDDRENIVGGIAIVQDITARKKSEEALRQSEERFKTLAAATFEGISITENGKILDVNDQLLAMLGYERHELIGNHIKNFIAPEYIPQAMSNIKSGMVVSNFEHAIRRKDGSLIYVQSHSSTIEQVGRALRLTAVIDITDRKRAEANLMAAKNEAERANRAKSLFLASVSHDLRQPLSALSLFFDVLKDRLKPGNDKLWLNIRRCIDDLGKMLSNMLDLSKLEAEVVIPEACDFSINEIIRNVVLSLEQEARVKDLVIRQHCSKLFGHTDPVLFQRIIANLVSNAIRYTERGGILIACRRRLGKNWVEIWDTGIGIPADKTTVIFDEFMQLANPERNQMKGSGLGLSIVAKTADLLGLQIRVQSRPGKGSMFAVEIPPGDTPSPTDQSQYDQKAFRIALVEDNYNVAEALMYGLTALGHLVTVAQSLSELLPMLEQAVAPDIVISDYRLSGKENGLVVISTVQHIYGSHIPGLIITGDTDPNIIRSMSLGGIPVLHKPLNIDMLQRAIMELTGTGH